MLDQMGEAILAGLLVLGAGADTDVDMDDGGFAINVKEKVEAIREGGTAMACGTPVQREYPAKISGPT